MSTAQEYKTDLLQFEVKRHPKCVIELLIEASSELAATAQEKATKLVGKEVVIDGFRKGKAPVELVLKNFPSQVEKKWEEALAELAFRESRKVSTIPVLNRQMKISYKFHEKLPSGISKLSVFFETEPEVPLVDPKEITLKKVERPKVDEEVVSETIRQAQMFFANWSDVVDRGIQMGDFARIDVESLEEDPPTKLFSSIRVEVTDRSMAKWMKELILGHRVGEALEGLSVADETASEEERAMPPKKVRVTILAVEAVELPPCDDAFAAKLGVATVEEMRRVILENLNQKADGHVREKQREQISHILLEKYPFDVPASSVETEVRYRMQQLLQDEEYQGHWNQMTSAARQRTIESVKEQSEKAIRMFYLCRTIVSKAGIQITPDVPKKPAIRPIDILSLGGEGYQDMGEPHQGEAFSRKLLEKAEDFLIENALPDMTGAG